MVKLRDKVKDSITGFEGIVVCRAEYLDGCIRVLVQPSTLTSDGAMLKALWIDESQLE